MEWIYVSGSFDQLNPMALWSHLIKNANQIGLETLFPGWNSDSEFFNLKKLSTGQKVCGPMVRKRQSHSPEALHQEASPEPQSRLRWAASEDESERNWSPFTFHKIVSCDPKSLATSRVEPPRKKEGKKIPLDFSTFRLIKLAVCCSSCRWLEELVDQHQRILKPDDTLGGRTHPKLTLAFSFFFCAGDFGKCLQMLPVQPSATMSAPPLGTSRLWTSRRRRRSRGGIIFRANLHGETSWHQLILIFRRLENLQQPRLSQFLNSTFILCKSWTNKVINPSTPDLPHDSPIPLPKSLQSSDS